MSRFARFSVCLLAVAAISFLAGCASTIENAHRHKEPIMAKYTAGLAAAAEVETKDEISGNVDELMWVLETGTLDFLLNDNDASIAQFNRATELIRDFDSRATVNARRAGSEIGSILANPNTLPYTGMCRDRIMIPVFRAFAYLGKGDEEGFRVELMSLRETQTRVYNEYHKEIQTEEQQINNAKAKNATAAQASNVDSVMSSAQNVILKQNLQETAEIARTGYGNFMNPFAIFLSGYGYMRDGDYQNALVDFKSLYEVLPASPLARQYYVTALKCAGRPIPANLSGTQPLNFNPGSDNVTVILANGRTAALQQMSMYIPVIVPGYGTVACVAWPVCQFYQKPISHVSVRAGGMEYATQPVSNMDAIMAREYYERLPGQLTRMILSVAAKEVGTYFATEAARRADGNLGVLVAIGAGVYKYAFNTADTRTWETLPSEYQVVQFPMPVDHKVSVNAGVLAPVTLDLPANARSAIIYVNVPSQNAAAVAIKPYYLYSK